MKRIIALIAGIFIIISVSKADDKPVKFEQLPKAARTFVATNFPENKVLLSTKDDDIISPEYEVRLDNGIKIEFRNDGKVEKVSAPQTGVPSCIIPDKIREYVSVHYPDVSYLEYEVDRTSHEVKLSNGLELRFSTSFHLVDIDD